MISLKPNSKGFFYDEANLDLVIENDIIHVAKLKHTDLLAFEIVELI